MKVELHLHTSRYSLCAVHAPEQMIERMIATGYQAVYITEHDAIWPEHELRDLQSSFPQIRIFPGIEKTLGSHHVLILGAQETEYLRLNDPRVLFERAQAAGHLVILAHPFRWPGGSEFLRTGPLPDAVEHCTCNQDGDRAKLSLKAAKTLDLPAVNAGDIHQMDYIDQYWIETDRPIRQADDIRQIVLDGRFRPCRRH